MELEHLPSTTSTTVAPDRIQTCESCSARPRIVVTWGGRTIVTPLCEECSAAAIAEREDVATRRHRDDMLRTFERDLGERYARYSFDGFPTAEPARADALTRVRKALDDIVDERRNLILFGSSNGSGKTSLAVSAGRWLIENEGIAARFFTVVDWLELIRASFQEGNDDVLFDAEAVARKTGLLIFDDLGAERVSEWVLERFSGVIDWRYRNYRPTIITSNLAPSELISHFDPEDPRAGRRIISRFMEDAVAIRLEASDLRLVDAAERQAA